MKKSILSPVYPCTQSYSKNAIGLLFVVMLMALQACNSPQAGKVNAIDTSQREPGVLAVVTSGPTTTSSIADGLYSPQSVSLSCEGTAGNDCLATYYTIDGTTPNRASSVYAGPIALWSKTTLKYFSIDKAGNIEPVKTQSFLVGSIAIRNITTFAGGWNHTLGIKNNGTLWAWGGNSSGQLGDGTRIFKPAPVQVGTGAAWKAIAAGNSFSLALKDDGTLWAWGSNSNGQLGDGTTVDRTSPVQIGNETSWKAIAAGTSFSLALKNDGSLWAWGGNSFGQLGDTTTVDRNVPLQVGTDKTWAVISAGYSHAVALKSNGTLWAWGGNSSGQLGNGTTTDSATPIQVTGEGWSAISAGGSGVPYSYTSDGNLTHVGGHTIALKSDGTLWAWGQNTFGQLGDGTYNYYKGWAGAGTYPLREYRAGADRYLPFQIGSDTDWSRISAGCGHSVALKSNGTLWAWGLNVNGQLANGNAGMNNMIPLPVGDDVRLPLVLPKRPWSSIAAGGYHTAALRSDGTLWAWGWNGSGQLGDSTTISTGGGSAPVTVTMGTVTTTSPTWKLPKYAYAVSDKVYPYSVDYDPGSGSGPGTGSGILTSTATPVSAGKSPTSAALHPAGRFLYVTDSEVATVNGEKISYVHQFSIDSTGGLTEIGAPAGVKTVYSPTSITVDPLGKFVYVVGTHSKGWKTIAVYTINPVTGELTCTGTVVQGAHAVAVEPLGRFAYVIKDAGVTSYSIDQTTGMLSSIIRGNDDFARADVPTSARFLKVDLSGQFLYVANDTQIRVFSIIQSSGNIVDTNQPLPKTAVSAMMISPRTQNFFPAQYMYMLNNSKLDVMTINQINGSITDSDTTPVSGPLGVAPDPTGKNVYVYTSGSVVGYSIDQVTGNIGSYIGSMATDAGAGGRALQALVFASY